MNQPNRAVFVPPPGWPPVSSEWLPESDWSPRSNWPPAPSGWQFYRGSYGEPIDPPAGKWQPTPQAVPDGGRPQTSAEPPDNPTRPRGEPRTVRRALWIGTAAVTVLALGGAAVAISQSAILMGARTTARTTEPAAKWTHPNGCPSGATIRRLGAWAQADLQVIMDYPRPDGTLACQMSGSWVGGGVDHRGGVFVTSSLSAGEAEAMTESLSPQRREASELGQGAVEIRSTSHSISTQEFHGCFLEVPLASPEGMWLTVGASGSNVTHQQACDTAVQLLQIVAR